MSEWKEYGLADVYDFASGLSKSADQFGFGSEFVSFKDVFQNFFLPQKLNSLVNSSDKEQKSCSVMKGDVFLTRTSETQEELGMSAVALKDYPKATFNGFAKRLRPKGTITILPEYAGYYFRSKKFRDEVTSMASMTTRASLNNGMLSALRIVVPPIEVQKRIGSSLKALDDKIDLLHRQNATLEKMAETLFRQWFVERSLSEAEGEAKEEWEIVKIGNLISIGSGKGLKKESFIENGLYPILGANGEIGKTNEFLFNEKLIYTGRVGTLGNIFRIDKEKVWLSDNTLVVKPIEYFNFIYLILKTSRLEDYNVGSTQPLIRQSDINEIEITLPPKDKLLEFESLTDKFFKKIKSNQTQIRTLTALRDTLLPKLMSGEVRVSEL